MDTVNDNRPPTRPPSPAAAPPLRLTRSVDDKVVSGLSGGLGRYFGVDPVVFRIAFVVMALAGGSGVLLYVVGWLLIPDDRGGGALPRVGKERNRKLLAAILAGAGVLLLANQLTDRHGGDVPIGLVLVGIGGLVLWSRRTQDGTGGLPVPAPPAASESAGPEGPPSASGVEPTIGSTDSAEAGLAAATSELPNPGVAVATRPHSALVVVTLSSLAILAGGLALSGVSARTGLAMALLLTGGALAVGAWRGRARWLIPVGLVLAAALAAASVIDVPVHGGTGEITFHPVGLEEVRSPYRLAAGHLVLDLHDLDLQGGTLTVVASVAVGDLEVVVPVGVGVDIDSHVGAGNLRVLGRLTDGFDQARPVREAAADSSGLLVLHLRTGVGVVGVRRAAA